MGGGEGTCRGREGVCIIVSTSYTIDIFYSKMLAQSAPCPMLLYLCNVYNKRKKKKKKEKIKIKLKLKKLKKIIII